MHANSFTFAGVTAPLLVRGQGPALVLLHGSADSPQAWAATLALLAADFEVFAPALPPLSPDTDLALDHDLPWLSALIAHTGARLLAGHSYGALLALRWALAHPEALDGLLLAEPIAWGVIRDDVAVAGTLHDLKQRCVARFAQGDPETALHWLVDYWNGAGFWRGLPQRVQLALVAGAQRTSAEVRSGDADRTDRTELAGLQLRTQVLAGALSTQESLQLAGALREGIAGAELTVIPDAGHQFLRSHAEVVAKAVRALLV